MRTMAKQNVFGDLPRSRQYPAFSAKLKF